MGFFGYPPSGAGQNPVAKGACFGGQISVLLGKWLFRRPKEKQASSDAADAGLGVSADAAMLVVSWPRCACFSSILALGVLQHVCLLCLAKSWYVDVCWVKTCFSPVAVFVWHQNCTY